MISKVKGNFKNFEGNTLLKEPNNPLSAKVAVTVDTESISTNDDNRDNHLRSGDFFDSENFPKASFASTSIEQKDKETLLVHGNLTIKGVTKEETFTVTIGGIATDPYGNTKAAEATTKI